MIVHISHKDIYIQNMIHEETYLTTINSRGTIKIIIKNNVKKAMSSKKR